MLAAPDEFEKYKRYFKFTEGDEFIGVVYVDEDEEGSYMFEVAILKEDL